MCMNFKKLCEIVGLLIIPVTLKSPAALLRCRALKMNRYQPPNGQKIGTNKITMK